MTHSYLKQRSAEYTKNTNYKITPQTSGKDFWDKFVSVSPNVVLVVCGHTGKPGDFEDAVAYRVDKNTAGKNVHQMMFNVQISGGGWEGNGGDGWLRILEFMPDGKTVKVKTYSPTLRNLSFHKTSRTPYRSLRPVRYADRFLTHLLERQAEPEKTRYVARRADYLTDLPRR